MIKISRIILTINICLRNLQKNWSKRLWKKIKYKKRLMRTWYKQNSCVNQLVIRRSNNFQSRVQGYLLVWNLRAVFKCHKVYSQLWQKNQLFKQLEKLEQPTSRPNTHRRWLQVQNNHFKELFHILEILQQMEQLILAFKTKYLSTRSKVQVKIAKVQIKFKFQNKINKNNNKINGDIFALFPFKAQLKKNKNRKRRNKTRYY